jgi:hypothetical protein
MHFPSVVLFVGSRKGHKPGRGCSDRRVRLIETSENKAFVTAEALFFCCFGLKNSRVRVII